MLLNPDHNICLRYLLKKTFYAHFCAGESLNEVRGVAAELKGMGYTGVILTYAKEAMQSRRRTDRLMVECSDDGDARYEVEMWKRESLETVRMAGEGDLVALK